MIIDAFIYLLIGLMELIGLLPEFVTIPSEWTESAEYFMGYALAFDGLIPIVLIISTIKWILLFELSLWFFRIGLNLVNWIRGAGKLDF